MPTFDLRNIKCAEYSENNGEVTYSNATKVGDSMSVDLNLRYAEGRLYAESSLAEFLKKCTGGTISIAVKYILAAAQQMMYGARAKTRTVGQKTISGTVYGSKDVAKNVGIAAYAPDMIDGVEKYTCFLVYRTVMGLPAMNFRTMGENFQFNTPTTSGEFMPMLAGSKDFLEVAVCDDEADAIAWVDLVLNANAAAQNQANGGESLLKSKLENVAQKDDSNTAEMQLTDMPAESTITKKSTAKKSTAKKSTAQKAASEGT